MKNTFQERAAMCKGIKIIITLLCLYPLAGNSTVLKQCFSTPVIYQTTYNRELQAAENTLGANISSGTLEGNGGDQEANCQCTGGLSASTSVTEITAVASPLRAGSSGRGYLTDRLDVTLAGYNDRINSSSSLIAIPITMYPTPIDIMSTSLDIKSSEKTASVCSASTAPAGASSTKRKFRWNSISINFHITKPIFGIEVIHPTTVATYYACLYYGSPACVQTDTQHVSDIVLSGSLTAPLSCTINAGGTIEVDLGDITTPQFVGKGLVPSGYQLKKVDISYHCDDQESRSSTDKIVLSLSADQGVAEGSDKLIAKMIGRNDVGVRMFDDNDNNVVLDGSVSFPLTLDQDGNGQIKMKAAPVSTTDARPNAGPFEGNVTVKMNIK